MNIFTEAFEIKEQPETCKGRFFRCSVNEYMYEETMGSRVFFKLLKRKSCPGCEKCSWFIDSYHDGTLLEFPDNPKHGGLYKLKIGNISRDWESGYIDDYTLELCEVKE